MELSLRPPFFYLYGRDCGFCDYMELSVLVPYSRAPTIWNGSVCSRPAGAPWRGDSRREKVRRIAAGAFRGRRAGRKGEEDCRPGGGLGRKGEEDCRRGGGLGRKGEEDCRRGGGVGPKSAVRWSPRPPKRHVTLNFWRPSVRGGGRRFLLSLGVVCCWTFGHYRFNLIFPIKPRFRGIAASPALMATTATSCYPATSL
jgi:hypothetical protein